MALLPEIEKFESISDAVDFYATTHGRVKYFLAARADD
jgi:hypothetical protein